MSGTPLKNLVMCQKICGENYLGNVILVTTMWSGTREDVEGLVVQEEKLKNGYWASMIARGSITLRFEGTRESAWSIIDHLITTEPRKQLTLIQEELASQGKKLTGTEAGQQLYGLAREILERQGDLLKRLEEELRKSEDTVVLQASLEKPGEWRTKPKKATGYLHQRDSSIARTLLRFFIPTRRQTSANNDGSNDGKRFDAHLLGFSHRTRGIYPGNSTATNARNLEQPVRL